MARLTIAVATTLLLLGCRPSSEEARLADTKFDPALRQKVADIARTGRPETLSLFGKCSGPIDDRARQKLAGAGAEILSVTGAIFTARVPSQRLVRVAKLELVTQLQLSTESRPSSP